MAKALVCCSSTIEATGPPKVDESELWKWLACLTLHFGEIAL